MASNQLDELRSLVSASEIIERDAPGYKDQSAPWSTWADQKPSLVVQPTSLESMSKVVKFLYDSDLDFAIRNTGTGSVSAKDVILSTHGFKSFDFDEQMEILTVGSGFSWGEVDGLMEKNAPGWQVVGARCSWVGVAGSSLIGGLSWLSHEYGMISDPQNLLDMQVVLRDGKAVWASEEPDLMWALRGGGGNFGVVTVLKFQARRYPTDIFTGIVFFPYSSLKEVSKGVARMHAQNNDPRVAMHVVNRGTGMGEPSQGRHPGIAIMMFDSHGEKHGLSEEGFAWVFQIPDGVVAIQEITTLNKMNALAESFRSWQGSNMFFLSAPLLPDIDDETLERAWKWWADCYDLYPGLEEGSITLLEFMQEPAMSRAGSRSATGWPHHGRRHVMQLVLGCKPEDAPSNIRDIIMKQLARAGRDIAGPHKDPKEYHAGFLHEWNDLEEVYAENLPKLKELKKQYDPKNRFNRGVDLAGEKISRGITV